MTVEDVIAIYSRIGACNVALQEIKLCNFSYLINALLFGKGHYHKGIDKPRICCLPVPCFLGGFFDETKTSHA